MLSISHIEETMGRVRGMSIKRFASSIFYLHVVTVCFFATTTMANESQVDGYIDFLKTDGTFETQKVTLFVPEGFKGTLTLKSKDQTIQSTGFQFARAGAYRFLSIAFDNLPQDTKNTVLILSGSYIPKGAFAGQAYTKSYESASEKAKALATFTSGLEANSYTLVGSFAFAAGRIRASGIRTSRTNDPNNPCPDGPGWSTGGTGKKAEFYSGGPIQNPGGARQAAGFGRGIPYEYTRQGQLQAQQIGIQRDWQYYRRSYNNISWGFGFFFR